MINSTYLSYLLALIKTKAYADEIIEKIDELKESLYNKRIDLDKKMGELFSYELKEKIKAYSWQEQVNLNDPISFGKFLTNLRGHIKNMPVVTVKIAFNPDEEIVKEITAWFVENYGKDILVDLQSDPGLVGGTVVVFNQQSLDFSLKKKLEEKYKIEDWQNFIDQVRNKPEISTDIKQTNGQVQSQII